MDIVTCPPGTKTTQLRLLVKRTGGSRSRGGDLPRVPPSQADASPSSPPGRSRASPPPAPAPSSPLGRDGTRRSSPVLSHGREGEPGPQAKVNVNIASHHHARPMPPPRPLMTNRPKDDHGRPPARPQDPPPRSQRQTQAGRVTTSRRPLSLRPTVLRPERKPVRWLLRGPSQLWAAAPGPRASSGLASLWRGLELQRPPLPHTPAGLTSWKIRNACLQSLVSLQASRPRWGTWTT